MRWQAAVAGAFFVIRVHGSLWIGGTCAYAARRSVLDVPLLVVPPHQLLELPPQVAVAQQRLRQLDERVDVDDLFRKRVEKLQEIFVQPYIFQRLLCLLQE